MGHLPVVQGGNCFAVDIVMSLWIVVLVLWPPMGESFLETWVSLVQVTIVVGVLPVGILLVVVVLLIVSEVRFVLI